jgi:hypothetical protein
MVEFPVPQSIEFPSGRIVKTSNEQHVQCVAQKDKWSQKINSQKNQQFFLILSINTNGKIGFFVFLRVGLLG